ncbi:MAG: hypothetical protein ABIK79_00105 [Chloroflexota bacterium]
MSGQGQGVTPGAYLSIQQRSAVSYQPTGLLTGYRRWAKSSQVSAHPSPQGFALSAGCFSFGSPVPGLAREILAQQWGVVRQGLLTAAGHL